MAYDRNDRRGGRKAVGRFAPSAWIRLRRLTTRMCRGSQIYFRPLQDPSAPCDRTCAAHQRELTTAIKRARHVALLPYTSD